MELYRKLLPPFSTSIQTLHSVQKSFSNSSSVSFLAKLYSALAFRNTFKELVPKEHHSSLLHDFWIGFQLLHKNAGYKK